MKTTTNKNVFLLSSRMWAFLYIKHPYIIYPALESIWSSLSSSSASNRDFTVEMADQIPGGSYICIKTTLSALNVFHIKHRLQITGRIWTLHLIWSQSKHKKKETRRAIRGTLLWDALCVLCVMIQKKLFYISIKNWNKWKLDGKTLHIQL